MLSRWLIAGLALPSAACVVDRHADPAPVTEPRTCNVDVVVTSDSAPTNVPLALDPTGQVVCLHLDASKVAAAHFAATTAMLPGDSSGIALVLQDPEYVALQDGWDVSDDSDEHTYANVEWNAPARELTEAILWLRAPQLPVATTLQLSMISPEP